MVPPGWPEVWHSFATSFFVTLLSAPGSGAVPPAKLARLAVELTLGLALTVALGLIFLVCQAAEYTHAYHELGLTLGQQVDELSFRIVLDAPAS